MVLPPNTDCVATPSASISTASVITPLPVRTARRPAASLPSALEGTSTAAGASEATRSVRTSTIGTTGWSVISSESAAYTAVAPYSPNVAAASPAPEPNHTHTGSPSRRARVSSSKVVFLTEPVSRSCSARTRTGAMARSFLDELVLGEVGGKSACPVAFIGDDGAGCLSRTCGEIANVAPGGRLADGRGFEPEIGDADRFHRLLLRRHDPLEGRVARFVDLLHHAHHSG